MITILDDSGDTIGIWENTTTLPTVPEYRRLFGDILLVTNLIGPPILITIGIIGNILSYIVLRKANYVESTYVYFRALTFFDSFTLLAYSFQRFMLKLSPGSFSANRNFFCKEFMFIAFFSMSISNWSLVLMTFDRFLAVVYPLKWTSVNTASRSKKKIITMAVVAFLFNTQQFLRVWDPNNSSVLKYQCPFDYDIVAKKYEIVHQHVFIFVVFYIPLFTLFILNILIVYKVRRRGKEKEKRSAQDASLHRSRRSQDRQVTAMLLLVTSVFIIAVTPFSLDHLVWDGILLKLDERDAFYAELRHVLYEVAATCLMINPAANFYLYCLGCHQFRKDLKSLFLSRGSSHSRYLKEHKSTSSEQRRLKIWNGTGAGPEKDGKSQDTESTH